MKIQRIQPERRLERGIVLGLLVTWGIASLATLGYEQLVNRDRAARPSVQLEQPEG